MALAACGGGGTTTAPAGGNVQGPAFTSSMMAGKVLQQAVSSTSTKVYTFNADNTLSVKATDSGVVKINTGTWKLNNDGTVTVVVGGDTMAMALIQNSVDYMVMSIVHLGTGVVDPIVSMSYVVSPGPTDPVVVNPFTAILVSGRPLQQAVSAGVTRTYVFDTNNAEITIIENNNGALSQDIGGWAIDKGKIVASMTTDTLSIGLNSFGTSLNVDITHADATVEKGAVLEYLPYFTNALLTQTYTATIYAGYYSATGTAWRMIDINSLGLFTFTDWSTTSVVDLSTTVPIIGAWAVVPDTGTLDIAAATATKNFSNNYVIVGQDVINKYWLVYSPKGPMSSGANNVAAVERWYYGADAMTKVGAFIQTGK